MGYHEEEKENEFPLLEDGGRVKTPFNYFGGKALWASWVTQFLPRDKKVYVEAYGGSLGVFFSIEPPYPIEVINDLDHNVVNTFRVLRDRETFDQLMHMLTWTPNALAVYKEAQEILASTEGDPVKRAWAFIVAHSLSFGGHSQWARAKKQSRRGMAQTSSKWWARVAAMPRIHSRLMRASIESDDALSVIKRYDSKETLFYLDPPYVLDTRGATRVYDQEVDIGHHRQLVEVLLGVEGAVVLSAHAHEVYDPLLEAGWSFKTKDTTINISGRKRTEALYIKE